MPATVHDGRLDLLAHNAAASELLEPLAATGRYGNNIVYQIFTVAYMANVSGSQPAGTYATTLTYVCTATF